MNNAAADAEELGEFGKLAIKSPVELLLPFYKSHYLVLFLFSFSLSSNSRNDACVVRSKATS